MYDWPAAVVIKKPSAAVQSAVVKSEIKRNTQREKGGMHKEKISNTQSERK